MKRGKYIQLNNAKEAKTLRKKLYKKQKGKCAILKKEIQFKDSVLDHQHKKKKEKAGKKGKGMVRGILHFQVNSFEGMVYKKYIRQGLHKMIDLPTLLRNLADYLSKSTTNYIHHSEKPKRKKMGKREYNKIKKYYFQIYPNRKKMPKMPKYKTKKWENLLQIVLDHERK